MKNMVDFKIGCSGFYNSHWKGVFYPEDLPSKQWLDFYSQQFNTLELNTTFYRFPTEKTFQTWFDKTPEDFIFSVKAPKLITHLKKFNEVGQLMQDFYLACGKGLKHKLGCTLFQLPPSFVYDEKKLGQIIEVMDPAFTNVIEFRHKSWWTKKVYDALTLSNIVFCTVSHPTMPDTLIAKNKIAYIRLHGVPKMFYSSYDSSYLEELFSNIKKKSKIRQAYVYFNNTADIAGVMNASQFQALIAKT